MSKMINNQACLSYLSSILFYCYKDKENTHSLKKVVTWILLNLKENFSKLTKSTIAVLQSVPALSLCPDLH